MMTTQNYKHIEGCGNYCNIKMSHHRHKSVKIYTLNGRTSANDIFFLLEYELFRCVEVEKKNNGGSELEVGPQSLACPV